MKKTILKLAKEENINKQNLKNGWSYLHMAVIFEDWELMDLLLQVENIDLLLVDKNNWNILFLSIEKNKNPLKLIECLEKCNNQDVVQQLLIYDNKLNQTALHLAIEKEKTTVALALINKLEPKDLNIQRKDGVTALHLAIMLNKKEVALALINKLEPKDLNWNGNSF